MVIHGSISTHLTINQTPQPAQQSTENINKYQPPTHANAPVIYHTYTSVPLYTYRTCHHTEYKKTTKSCPHSENTTQFRRAFSQFLLHVKPNKLHSHTQQHSHSQMTRHHWRCIYNQTHRQIHFISKHTQHSTICKTE